ncbi:eCIS core domain-containing protein [Algoriphagus formosus]|uniref:DUF4157 domain-containing protein n=1 Tax=Algoriphagus formosus TaxID=2007308 RepID=A0A4R5V7C6_9BACT|nr:DUF4157 domain-containing protein [Algoriphagus aquimaris]TDK47932.1 DUF4157 domain-containing protein [Algoriphagus aquimaris]
MRTLSKENGRVIGSSSPQVNAKTQVRANSPYQFVDNRPEAIAQRELKELANNSNGSRSEQAAQFQSLAGNKSFQAPSLQRKENKTGLPDDLKSGIENLSGYSLDDVKVHYNSDQPSQLQAYAFAQGTDIHLASGQEKHLPHEAWHVVQQKQGRVKATMQMKAGPENNDNAILKKAADLLAVKHLKGEKNQQQNMDTFQLKAEVKITKDGLDLGREHDLKRYLDLSYSTSEKGKTKSEMQKQNTYRHMDSQATRRDAMANVMRFYLEDNEVVNNATELCGDLQPNIDMWEQEIEGEGGQFLGNPKRNSAISNEYDSLVLELLIQDREVTEEAIDHDLRINLRNTTFKVLGDNKDNIHIALNNAYSEESTEESDFVELLPIFQSGVKQSLELTYAKLSKSKQVDIPNLRKKLDSTYEILSNALRSNPFEVMKIFYKTVKSADRVVDKVAEKWNSTDEDELSDSDEMRY